MAEVIDAKKVIGTTKAHGRDSRKTASITVKPTTAGKKLLAATKGKTAQRPAAGGLHATGDRFG